MISDWKNAVEEVNREYTSPRDCLYCVYTMLISFAREHRDLFEDSDAEAIFHSVSSQRHRLLRDQVAQIISPSLDPDDAFLSEFIAESLLTWTMAGKSFDEIYRIIEKTIK
jgi:hypothetical protein